MSFDQFVDGVKATLISEGISEHNIRVEEAGVDSIHVRFPWRPRDAVAYATANEARSNGELGEEAMASLIAARIAFAKWYAEAPLRKAAATAYLKSCEARQKAMGFR